MPIRNKALAAAVYLIPVALNLWAMGKLFGIGWLPHFNSIEGAFIGFAAYISRHWGDLGWFPLWHNGMPFSNVYVPGLHLAVAALSTLTGWTAGHAYHAAVAAAYVAGPVTLAVMARALGAGRGEAFVAAVFFCLFSPAALLRPEFQADLGGWQYPLRLRVLTVWGEGPHVTALALMPLAIAALQRAPGVAAAVAIALVMIVNTPGTMGLGLAVFCWIAAQERGRAQWRAMGAAAACSAAAYALIAFAWPPSAVAAAFRHGAGDHPGFARGWPAMLVLLAALFAVGSRLPARLPVRFAVLSATLTGIAMATADSARFELLPQAGRMSLEFELAAAMLVGMAVVRLRRFGWIAFAVFAVMQAANYRHYAGLILQEADLTQRSEYRVAKWLEERKEGVGRVYAPGSIAFWLNAFAPDVPQFTGCCDQSTTGLDWRRVVYLINGNDYKGEWIEALGIQTLVAPGPGSTEVYKDFRNPDKFHGRLLMYEEGGDRIYHFPTRSRGAAYAVLRTELPGPDDKQVERYVRAIEDRSRPWVAVRWANSSHAVLLTTHLRPDDIVSFQTTFAPGWRATANGRTAKVFADGLGMIAIESGCTDNCEIHLRWEGSPDLAASRAVSAVALLIAAACVARALFAVR